LGVSGRAEDSIFFFPAYYVHDNLHNGDNFILIIKPLSDHIFLMALYPGIGDFAPLAGRIRQK